MNAKTIALDFQRYLVLRLNVITYVLSYSVPFMFSHPQIITGMVVNTLIFVAAEKLDRKSLIPVLVLPSLGAFSHGILFGPQTVFLVYFLPFIWLGNFIQASVFSISKQQSYTFRVLAASLSKYFFLSLAASIYYQVHIVPQMFVTSMGIMQLITSCMGGLFSYFVIQFVKEKDYERA
jgi:hypothetical protein